MLNTRNFSILLLFILFAVSTVFSNDKIRCSTVEVFNRNAINHPDAITRKAQLETKIQQWLAQNASKRQNGQEAIITIPVVVHVVYNTSLQNISDAQIKSQIDRLNKDFSNANADRLLTSNRFYSITGNANLEFCIANIDPNGNATNGIIRTSTNTTEFSNNDDVKFSVRGGADAWDATEYLNIWVCKLSGDLLGYAQYPSDLSSHPETDGVVVGYNYFGTTGTLDATYNLGRTATHEIGHWLNLEHIWGDDENYTNKCGGSDKVADTPNQEVASAGCPSGVVNDACNTTASGILYQNYMDYTDDACMVMFTKGQVDRMHAVLDIARKQIEIANKCSATTGISVQTNKNLKIYPNPIQNYLTIEGLPQTKTKFYFVDIFNTIGQKVYGVSISAEDTMIEMAGLKTGTYVMMVYNNEFSTTQKITVVK